MLRLRRSPRSLANNIAGYYPKEEGSPGQRKNLKVRVYRENLNVRARDNYLVKDR